MEIFNLTVGQSPLILSMPHSGLNLPPSMHPRLTPAARLIPDTDWHIPALYNFASDLDATIIQSNYNRLVIDLNRPPDDKPLYPGQAGSGLCPDQLFDGTPVYFEGEEPDEDEENRRLRQYWTPYHDTIQAQIERVKALHGFAVLYDCHSINSNVPRLFDGQLPDLNLGTANGTSCAVDLQNKLEQTMQASNFSSACNGRFVGGYITRQFGDPENQIHTIQMELGQSAYMDDPQHFNASLAAPLQQLLHELLQIILHWRPGQKSLL
ncbi:MAG: N-formylglutamate deformylase [Parasphingorhabdus sp.]|jgi:N-formylglutamate deformylase